MVSAAADIAGALRRLNVTISAAAEAGSSGDPLVTLSYLNETFMDSIMERVDQKIEARNAQLASPPAPPHPPLPW